MKKMKRIAVSSFKGGTAKTSSALHIGACLAKYHKKKVLLIDFDAQANLTTGLGYDPDAQDSLAPVLQGKKSIDKVILKTEIANLDLIPGDLWNLEPRLFRETYNAAAEHAESRRATIELLAPLEQRLVTDANAEERPTGLDEFAGGLEQFLLAQRIDAVIKRTHAGQYNGPRVAHPLRALHDLHIRADLEQRLVDAAQVAGTVIKQSNHRANSVAPEVVRVKYRMLPASSNRSGRSCFLFVDTFVGGARIVLL